MRRRCAGVQAARVRRKRYACKIGACGSEAGQAVAAVRAGACGANSSIGRRGGAGKIPAQSQTEMVGISA